MARGKDNKAGESEGTDTKAEEATAPIDYRRVSSVQDAPFVASKEGNTVSGALLNRYAMQGNQPGNRHYYQIELDKPCTIVRGKGEEATEEEVPAGTIVNLGENKQIADSLKPVIIPEINASAAYKVHLLFKKKIKISQGRTLWIIDVYAKRTKGPVGVVTPLPPDAAGEGDEGESAF